MSSYFFILCSFSIQQELSHSFSKCKYLPRVKSNVPQKMAVKICDLNLFLSLCHRCINIPAVSPCVLWTFSQCTLSRLFSRFVSSLELDALYQSTSWEPAIGGRNDSILVLRLCVGCGAQVHAAAAGPTLLSYHPRWRECLPADGSPQPLTGRP